MPRFLSTLFTAVVIAIFLPGCGPSFKLHGTAAETPVEEARAQTALLTDAGSVQVHPDGSLIQSLNTPQIARTWIGDSNLCIESLCRPVSKNRSSSNSLAARGGESPLFKKLWSENYAAKVTFALSFESVTGQAITRLVENDPTFTLSTSQARAYRAIFGATLLIRENSVGALQTLDIDSETKTFHINKVRFNTWIATFPKNKGNALRFITAKMLVPMRNATFALTFAASPLASFLALQEPGAKNEKELAETVTMMLNDLEKQVGYGARYLIPAGEISAAKVLRGEKLSVAEENALVRAYGELIAYSLAVTDEGRRLINLVADPLDQVLEKFRQADGYNHLRNRQLVPTSPKWGSTHARCEAQFRNMMAMSPVETRRVKALALRIREIAISVAQTYAADAKSASEIAAAINQIEFNFSGRGSERLRKFRSELDFAGLIFKRNSELLTADPKKAKNIVMLKALIDGSVKQVASQTEAQKLCDKYAITSASDITLQAEAKIDVSWFTALTPEVGAGVIAHEIGHVVSFNLRNFERARAGSTRFLRSLNCIAHRNRFDVTPRELGSHDDTVWSEEDWADHFASSVITEFKKSSEASQMDVKNFACGMAVDNGQMYPDEENRIEPQQGDTHSNGFLRMLLISHDLGQPVTTQCQPFVDYLTSTGRNLTCQ
jgi:hypothetical protein